MIIWLTGLSGAGKSTLAEGVAARIRSEGSSPLLIDRDGLHEDRAENIRRAGAIALVAARSGITSICSLISPLRREKRDPDSLHHLLVNYLPSLPEEPEAPIESYSFQIIQPPLRGVFGWLVAVSR